ncbi:hypothetical protein VUR80DRAFT_2763 [Thermomyces stellatus]
MGFCASELVYDKRLRRQGTPADALSFLDLSRARHTDRDQMGKVGARIYSVVRDARTTYSSVRELGASGSRIDSRLQSRAAASSVRPLSALGWEAPEHARFALTWRIGNWILQGYGSRGWAACRTSPGPPFRRRRCHAQLLERSCCGVVVHLGFPSTKWEAFGVAATDGKSSQSSQPPMWNHAGASNHGDVVHAGESMRLWQCTRLPEKKAVP